MRSYILPVLILMTAAAAVAGPFDPATRRTHREVVTASGHTYTIAVGGTADMERTLSRDHSNIKIAFQNNLSLILNNTGNTTIRNPKLLINGRGDWGDVDSLIREWTRGAAGDQERALMLWQNMRENRYHSMPLYADSEFHDPVRLFNIYGLALCDDDGYAGCGLFTRAGLGKPKYATDSMVRSLNGHVQCEAALDNGLQFLDVDQDCFYLDRENERPISGDALMDDHDLVRREMNYGPTVSSRSWRSSESVASLFGADDKLYEYSVLGHRMDYDLRPGEMVIFRWDNIGKFAAQSKEWAAKPVLFGNSKFVYRPRLDPESLRTCAVEVKDLKPELKTIPMVGSGSRQAWVASATSPEAAIVYAVKVPYTICGGNVTCTLEAHDQKDGAAVDFSLDGKSWQELAREERDADGKLVGRGQWPDGGQVFGFSLSLETFLDVQNNPPKRQYYIRVRPQSRGGEGSVQLISLTLETDVMAAPMALPRLLVGENHVVYTDETEAPHELTISHAWQESSALTPPAPAAAPEYPLAEATIRDAMLTYRWPATEGANAYHLQVSTYPDMKLIYRPSLDVIIPENQWLVPFTGIYSPDTDYYWRVRARNGSGLWGGWSPIWRFRWDGPRVPVNVRVEMQGQRAVLKWDANPRGPRAVKYEVYGSDEKGFLCSKTEYDSYGRGKVPGNFMTETARSEIIVLEEAGAAPNMNRCFYRVVAVDANGTPSGSSAYVELPHPFIYSRPPNEAQVGQAYRYQVRLVQSLGDCQHRGNPAKQRFHDIEEYTFKMTGPAWLKVDEAGVLTGTPAEADRGEAAVKVEAANQFGKSAVQEFRLAVKP